MVVGQQVVGCVESDPPSTGHQGFGPGVCGQLLTGGTDAGIQVSHDIAGRNSPGTGYGDEEMGKVLADAAALMNSCRQ